MKLCTSSMIQLIRLFGPLNSPFSRRFVTSSTIFPLRRVQNSLTFTPCLRLSSPQFSKAACFTTKLGLDPLELTTPAGEHYVVVGYQGQGGENVNSEQRRALPEELARRVRILTCDSTAEGTEGGKCNVYLIGTIHVYEKSFREVQKVVSHLKPQVVFLELCSSRVPILTGQKLKVPSLAKILWKDKHPWFRIIFGRFYAKCGKKLNVSPGLEFRVAFEEARKYGGKVILGDRPIEITIRRALGRMKLGHKAILHLFVLLAGFFLHTFSRENLVKRIEKMYDEYDDHAVMMDLPFMKSFNKAVVDERDQYLAFTLWRVARRHRSVVAVVGMGHLRGIKSHWKQHVNMNDLLKVPSLVPIVSAIEILASVAIIYIICSMDDLYKRWKYPSSLQEIDFVEDTPL